MKYSVTSVAKPIPQSRRTLSSAAASAPTTTSVSVTTAARKRFSFDTPLPAKSRLPWLRRNGFIVTFAAIGAVILCVYLSMFLATIWCTSDLKSAETAAGTWSFGSLFHSGNSHVTDSAEIQRLLEELTTENKVLKAKIKTVQTVNTPANDSVHSNKNAQMDDLPKYSDKKSKSKQQKSGDGIDSDKNSPKNALANVVLDANIQHRNGILQPSATQTALLQQWRESASIPVVILTFNRPKYLRRTLESVMSYLKAEETRLGVRFPVLISQDGIHKGVADEIMRLTREGLLDIFHLGFDYESLSAEMRRKKKGFESRQWNTYHKISAHYKWMLSAVFDSLQFHSCIILEDDMRVAPDFFNYFANVGAPLLLGDNWKSDYHSANSQPKKLLIADAKMDGALKNERVQKEKEKEKKEAENVYCVSGWNDNGQSPHVWDARALYRTDVFPGLGWMLSRRLWTEELSAIWTPAFWDDWMRTNDIRKQRTCVRPEVNRVYTFGEEGSSAGQFYRQFLKPIKLNEEYVDWANVNLDYIKSDEAFTQWLASSLLHSSQLTFGELMQKKEAIRKSEDDKDYVVVYKSLDEYTHFASRLKLMTDHKEFMPRTSFKGVVTIRVQSSKHRLHFVNKDNSFFALS